MSTTIATTADGRFRVTLEPDETCEDPRRWEDVVTGALSFPASRWIEVPKAGPLADGWDRLVRVRDTSTAVELFTRWARVFHGAVVEFDAPADGPAVVWYLTRAAADAAGIIPDLMRAALDADRSEWRSWAEGDVYMATVEERITWVRADGDSGERETWEPVDTWGTLSSLIGYDHAEAEARRMLADVAHLEGDQIPRAAFVDAVTNDAIGVQVGDLTVAQFQERLTNLLGVYFPQD